MPPEAVQRTIEDIVALLAGECRDLSAAVLDWDAVPDFNRRVYDVARAIPAGSTLSYGEVAERLGDRNLARDVAQALGQNPFPIIVPCHRVMAAGGKTGGFSAPGGVRTKLRLLSIEGAQPGGPTLVCRSSARDATAPARLILNPAREHRRVPRCHVNTIYMNWSKEDKESPRGYHHGNLKEALLRAALELIAQKGPAGFTFAEAARWAGVSPAAPYRHFRDRDELLASVALRGFHQFEQALARAWDEGRPDVFFALDRLGRAYLDFARSEPAYYSAMFEAGVPLADNPELRDAGDRAFAVLRAAAEKLCAQVPARDRPPALMVALHIWAMAHGIASLFGRGDAARRALPIAAEELLEAQTLIYLRGLGVASAKPAQ